MLALQSAFLWPETRIKLVLAQHCAFDLDSFAFSPRPLYVPEAASASISEYLSNIKPGTFRVSSPSPEYRGLFQAAFNTGRYRDLLRGDRHMRIREALRKAKDVPPIWIAQGVNDRIVSCARNSRERRHRT